MSQKEQITEKKERKTDRRTIYTKKVIMDSYIQLLKEKPKDKIKITELCRAAEINRCTFYLHFEDINAVEAAIEEELFVKFKDFVETQNPEVRNRLSISDTFQNAMLHDDTYITLMSVCNPTIFSNFMEAYYQDAFKASLPEGHHLSERKQELLYTFIVGGVTAVQKNWITNKDNIKAENHFLDKMVQQLMSIKENSADNRTL